MAKTPSSYQRLPGNGRGIAETSRLYLGADHLLLVTSTGWTESYRRFYFRDIQSFTLHKTVTGVVVDVILGWLVCLSTAAAFTMEFVGFIVWLGIAGIFGLLLAINLIRGPTCVCQIRTAVQTRILPPLSRVRRAQKVLTRLKPFINEAQGQLPPEELTRRLEEIRRGGGWAATAPVAGDSSAPSAQA